MKTTNNIYVRLNEVNRVLKLNGIQPGGDLPHIWHDINYIPTIDLSEDKTIQTIDEMIEEYPLAGNVLQKLKSRLSPKI